jgi:hypothetical protein
MAVDDAPLGHDDVSGAAALGKGVQVLHAGAAPSDSAELAWRSAGRYSSSSGGSTSAGGGSFGGRAASPSAGDNDADVGGGKPPASPSGAARGARAGSSHPQQSEASCGYCAGDVDDLAAAHVGGCSVQDDGCGGAWDDEEAGGEQEDHAEEGRNGYDGSCEAGEADECMEEPAAAVAPGGAFCLPPLRRWCVNCASGVVLPEHPGLGCSKCGHRPTDDDALFAASPSDGGAAAAPPPAGDPGLILCWDDAMLAHEEDDDCPHPERPDRLRAVTARLAASGLARRCRRVPARPASDEELLRVHTHEHVSRLRAAADWPPGALHAAHWLPADTYVNEHTFDAALLAAGTAAEVATAVARGEARAGAAIIRPPGHHAESNTAMGFCFFNNAAVAARAARAAGAERVLILDWDVHHGNGTQVRVGPQLLCCNELCCNKAAQSAIPLQPCTLLLAC